MGKYLCLGVSSIDSAEKIYSIANFGDPKTSFEITDREKGMGKFTIEIEVFANAEVKDKDDKLNEVKLSLEIMENTSNRMATVLNNVRYKELTDTDGKDLDKNNLHFTFDLNLTGKTGGTVGKTGGSLGEGVGG